jgi:hypothetical protein
MRCVCACVRTRNMLCDALSWRSATARALAHAPLRPQRAAAATPARAPPRVRASRPPLRH